MKSGTAANHHESLIERRHINRTQDSRSLVRLLQSMRFSFFKLTQPPIPSMPARKNQFLIERRHINRTLGRWEIRWQESVKWSGAMAPGSGGIVFQ